jgi:hypothetical protein
LYRIALSMLDDREIPQAIEDVDVDGHRVSHPTERHPVESDDVAGEDKIFGASGDVDVVVRISLTKPRMCLIRVVAPELLVIDGLDLLTGLSTLATCTLRPALSGPTSLRNSGPNSRAGSVPDAAGGVFPHWRAFNH